MGEACPGTLPLNRPVINYSLYNRQPMPIPSWGRLSCLICCFYIGSSLVDSFDALSIASVRRLQNRPLPLGQVRVGVRVVVTGRPGDRMGTEFIEYGAPLLSAVP